MVLIKKKLNKKTVKRQTKKLRSGKNKTRRVKSIIKGGYFFPSMLGDGTVMVNHQPIPYDIFTRYGEDIPASIFKKIRQGTYKTTPNHYMVYVSKGNLEVNPRLYLPEEDTVSKSTILDSHIYYAQSPNPNYYIQFNLKKIIVIYAPDRDRKDCLKLIAGEVINDNCFITDTYTKNKDAYAILSTSPIKQIPEVIRELPDNATVPDLKLEGKGFGKVDLLNLTVQEYKDNRQKCDEIIRYFQPIYDEMYKDHKVNPVKSLEHKRTVYPAKARPDVRHPLAPKTHHNNNNNNNNNNE